MLLFLLFRFLNAQNEDNSTETTQATKEIFETSSIGNSTNYRYGSRLEKLKEDEGRGYFSYKDFLNLQIKFVS